MTSVGVDATHPSEIFTGADEARDGGDVVFHEDFANGLFGNTEFGAWSTAGPNGNIWKWTTNGPNGAYTNAGQIIVSTTAANGFMLFASDSANTNWSANPPVIVANPVDLEGALVSPIIDLTATPYVELEWRQRLRYCCGGSSPHWVDVSTNGGLSWPIRVAAAPGRAANDDPGSETRKINLSAAIAADPSNVRIRFFHEATSSHYHWQIDDVRIVELYEHDLRVESVALTAFDLNTAMTYDSIPYSIFPYSQLRPMGLNMTVLNNGTVAQDAVANFTVTSGAATVLDQDQPVNGFAAGSTQTVFVSPDFTPPAEAGSYTVNFSISSEDTDNTPADNSATRTFAVSEHVYARDNGSLSTHLEEGGDGELIVCNAFYVANDAELHSIQVALRTGTEIGGIVAGELRTDLEQPEHFSNDVIVTANMLSGVGGGNFVHLPFDPPVQVTAGTDYFACVMGLGTVRIGQGGSSVAQTSFVYFNGPSGLDWYYTTTTPMVRMNFGALGTGVEGLENTALVGQNTPNPADMSTFIDYEVVSSGSVALQVRDISGKLVMEGALGNQAPGRYRTELNTSVLPAGVYTYTLTTGAAHATKRMVVIH